MRISCANGEWIVITPWIIWPPVWGFLLRQMDEIYNWNTLLGNRNKMMYTTPKKYPNAYKWSDNSKSEKVFINQSNTLDAEFCPAHFDTLLVELRWFWAPQLQYWERKNLSVKFSNLKNGLPPWNSDTKVATFLVSIGKKARWKQFQRVVIQ